ncbi:uncharacterized protein LOC107273318 [Cephus cinctus]|uniref:Uncharacterized protein LOC107273318 n=1 Tax=Cephus cinctus TaxID=211228 RepID=A0AAJ7RSN8_CEPCN|nr:uncharacterized protein LOC107273318 [Cephus cinctus]
MLQFLEIDIGRSLSHPYTLSSTIHWNSEIYYDRHTIMCLKIFKLTWTSQHHIILILMSITFILIKNASASDTSVLRHIASNLQPEECLRIVSYNLNPTIERVIRKDGLNAMECFHQLYQWTSELKVTRRDVQLVLENRLRQIGRDDLITWLTNLELNDTPILNSTNDQPLEQKYPVKEKETIRKLKSVPEPTLSKINDLISNSAGLGSNHDSISLSKDSVSTSDLVSRLNFLLGLAPARSKLIKIRENQDDRDTTTSIAPEKSPFAQFHPVSKDNQSEATNKNEKKVETNKESIQVRGNGTGEANKTDPFTRIKEKYIEGKPYVNLPIIPALMILGIVIFCACFCALLIRYRLAVCFNKLRGKKKKKTSRFVKIP